MVDMIAFGTNEWNYIEMYWEFSFYTKFDTGSSKIVIAKSKWPQFYTDLRKHNPDVTINTLFDGTLSVDCAQRHRLYSV